ncbi:hypothetical protein CLIB1423_04S03026 [[Candida] railenensis]|uniref:Uncharacterized protein n=1 Tax=[Candida] railenensis TaxID=45579 RepID=A0A9P0QMV6_9ASCO|nr:hypothetical protein CLIB1423_04S03026 [[Candida] railenensis]
MRFSYCVCLFISINAAACAYDSLSISGRIKSLKPSRLLKIFNDVKYEAYEVEDLEGISISKLRKYGIARILSTNSIIVSESLAENVLDPFNLSLDGIFKKGKSALLNDFYEISYQDMATTSSYSPWKPIDDCVSTKRSNGPVTVTRGWSTSIGTGVTTTLKLATMFGVTPSFSTDYFGVVGVSGAITCTAESGKMLQFVVRNQIFNISGIKKRKVNIKEIRGRWGQGVSELDYSDDGWEEEPVYSIINSRNIQTYCITDPKYQTC